MCKCEIHTDGNKYILLHHLFNRVITIYKIKIGAAVPTNILGIKIVIVTARQDKVPHNNEKINPVQTFSVKYAQSPIIPFRGI